MTKQKESTDKKAGEFDDEFVRLCVSPSVFETQSRDRILTAIRRHLDGERGLAHERCVAYFREQGADGGVSVWSGGPGSEPFVIVEPPRTARSDIRRLDVGEFDDFVDSFARWALDGEGEAPHWAAAQAGPMRRRFTEK